MFPRALTAGAVLAVVFASQPVTAQRQPSEQHKRLQFFVGDWKIEGEEKASPSGPGANQRPPNIASGSRGTFMCCVERTSPSPGARVKSW